MDVLSERKYRRFSRRSFLGAASALGASSLVSYPSTALAAPPPETPKITLFENPVSCLVPQYVAKELLHAEGFSDVRYLKWPNETQKWVPEVLLAGEADISLSFVPSNIVQIEAGGPVIVLAGSHTSCVELVGGPRVKSALDLKGKKVAMQMPGPTSRFLCPCSLSTWGSTQTTSIGWSIKVIIGSYLRMGE